MSKIRNLFLRVLGMIASTIFFPPFNIKIKRKTGVLLRFKIVYGLFTIRHVVRLFLTPKKHKKTKPERPFPKKKQPEHSALVDNNGLSQDGRKKRESGVIKHTGLFWGSVFGF